MKLKTILMTVAAVTALSAGAASATTYVYVGSWHVGDGPQWSGNPDPLVYTGQEAAALLFGGSASQYAISTAGPDVSLINFRAHVDGWGDSQYLFSDVAQDYSLSTNGGFYNHYPAYSAYVLDHSCGNRYADNSLKCASTEPGINYAFKAVGGVPEPATWALMISGFGLAGAALRRRRVIAA